MNWDTTSYLAIENYSDHPEVARAARMLVDTYFEGMERKRDDDKLFRDAKKLVASLWIRDADMFRFTTKTEAFSKGKSRQVWMTNRTLKLFKQAEELEWFRHVQNGVRPRPDEGFQGFATVYCRSAEFRKLMKSLTLADIEVNPDLPRVELREERVNTKGNPIKALCDLPAAYLASEGYRRTVDILAQHSQLLGDSKPELDGKPLIPNQYFYVRKFNKDEDKPHNFKGGRFYAPFTNWPKADRQRLKLNGEPVGSLDISQLHPALILRYLYKADREQSGMLFDAQPEVYSMPDYPNLPRAVHKKLINTLINAANIDSAIKSIQTATYWFDDEDQEWVCKTYTGRQKRQGEKVFPDKPGVSARDYIARFTLRHPMMEPAICSGLGHLLQTMDSMLIENILWIATGLGVPVLPVHDEIILPESMKSFGQVLLERAFPYTFEEYGNFGTVKTKWTTLELGSESITIDLSVKEDY